MEDKPDAVISKEAASNQEASFVENLKAIREAPPININQLYLDSEQDLSEAVALGCYQSCDECDEGDVCDPTCDFCETCENCEGRCQYGCELDDK